MAITFTKRPARAGSSITEIEAARDGKPVGFLWTTRSTRSTVDAWHATTLTGQSMNFTPWASPSDGYPSSGSHGTKARALAAAKLWLAQQAGG